MQGSTNSLWPILKSYAGSYIDKIAMPLGGIGTGTVSLGGRGDLRDWEIMNRPAKGFTPERAFFAIRIKDHSGKIVARALEGPLALSVYEGAFGATVHNHGLPRFKSAKFDVAYPLAQVHFGDPDIPVQVRLEAFNPMEPANTALSSYPAAVLRYVITNPTDQSLDISICGNLRNFIGRDGRSGSESNNRNEFRDGGGVCGIAMSSRGVDPTAEQYGTIALVTPISDFDISYRTDWQDRMYGLLDWKTSLLDDWDDFTDDGKLDEREPSGADNPTGSLCAGFTVPANESRSVTFILAWHFPNRLTWTPVGEEEARAADTNPDIIGNYYTHRFSDAWNAASTLAANLSEAEATTVKFVDAFVSSDLPEVVKEAALFNLSTIRSQTVFQTPDGKMFGWEGCSDSEGCCHGSCTHVWNYETAVGSLYGELSRSMRDVEFQYMTNEAGLMSFRVSLPLTYSNDYGLAAADGQMGTLTRLYRDWKLSGDDDFLKRNWPSAKRALEFAWIPNGWDPNQDGVMEGCQHNTMDVEYYGPNALMSFWYLSALRACEAMSRHMGESEFADKCRAIFESGSRWIDENLFNGEYYEQKIIPPRVREAIAPGLLHFQSIVDLDDPNLQLGSACAVDQLVGQYMASVCGLGPLADTEHIKTALLSIYRNNYKPTMRDHFNNMRTYALGDEAATVMASYPHGERPLRPFPYFCEVMTGYEYVAAIAMLQSGLADEGLTLIRAVRERYDGLRRNPFDEAECGHHYARAMASWSAVLTLTGFDYDGTTGIMTFDHAEPGTKWFWSTGNAWGIVAHKRDENRPSVDLHVLGGMAKINEVRLR